MTFTIPHTGRRGYPRPKLLLAVLLTTKMTKQDTLNFLNSLKKPEATDPNHKSIGTYNGRQMILSR
jgi:hypothetical protein